MQLISRALIARMRRRSANTTHKESPHPINQNCAVTSAAGVLVRTDASNEIRFQSPPKSPDYNVSKSFNHCEYPSNHECQSHRIPCATPRCISFSDGDVGPRNEWFSSSIVIVDVVIQKDDRDEGPMWRNQIATVKDGLDWGWDFTGYGRGWRLLFVFMKRVISPSTTVQAEPVFVSASMVQVYKTAILFLVRYLLRWLHHSNETCLR